MSSKERDLHQQLFFAYKGSYADLPAQQCQKNASEIWRTAIEKLKNKEKFIVFNKCYMRVQGSRSLWCYVTFREGGRSKIFKNSGT